MIWFDSNLSHRYGADTVNMEEIVYHYKQEFYFITFSSNLKVTYGLNVVFNAYADFTIFQHFSVVYTIPLRYRHSILKKVIQPKIIVQLSIFILSIILKILLSCAFVFSASSDLLISWHFCHGADDGQRITASIDKSTNSAPRPSNCYFMFLVLFAMYYKMLRLQ